MADRRPVSVPLWRSAALRTVALSGLLFLLSALLLFAFLYRDVVTTVEAQTLRLSQAQAVALAGALDADKVSPREAPWPVGRADEQYRVVIDQHGRKLLEELPLRRPIIGPVVASRAQLRSLLVSPGEIGDSGLIGYGIVTADKVYVFVGHEDEQVGELREAMVETMGLGLALIILLYSGAGLVLARMSFARVARMNAVAQAVMAGDLSRRMTLSRGNDEIDDLTRQLNRMFDALERSVNAIRQVSSDIAHDMRTPLTRLRQRLEELGQDADPQARTALLRRASDDADQALSIFAAMLRIAQIESGSARSHFVTIDLSRLLVDLGEIYEPVFRDSGHALTSGIDADVSLQGDPALLQQLFANLLENAIRHTPTGATARLELHTDGGSWVARVVDTGPGIALPERQAVFDRFYRSDASRTRAGAGLGLALAKAIAEAHDLTIAVEESDGCSIAVRPASPG